MMWVTYNSTLRRLVGSGCCIHMFQDQRRLKLQWQGGIESQRLWPSHGGPVKSLWFWIYLITLYQLTQTIPGSDLGLIELMWRVIYDKFAASNSVWISCGGWWILYRSWFPIMHISRDCAGWNRQKSTGIPGGADPRFTLCEDETSTRGCGSSAL